MSSPLKPPQKHAEEQEDWLLTFADMVVILMCFFIMLFALTFMPPEKQQSFADALKEGGFAQDAEARDPYQQLVAAVVETFSQPNFEPYVLVTPAVGKVEIELASSAFFPSGSAQFKREAMPIMEEIAAKLQPFMESKVEMVVEGHTDDSPISSSQFPSNWELSGARASNVVRYLIAKGIDGRRLSIQGYADTKPKAENRDAEGNPISANQELNRRVVIKVVKLR